MGRLYASDIIMITVCLLLGLQSLPCQSTGKSNHQQRALWVQAISKLLHQKTNPLNESVSFTSYTLQKFAS